MLCGLPSLYGSRQIDGSSVKKDFFSQCRLTGVRVRNDRKGAPSLYFICKSCQWKTSNSNVLKSQHPYFANKFTIRQV